MYLFVLPVHNQAIILSRFINTLLHHLRDKCSFQSWKIVIADNGSTDGTCMIAEQLRYEHPKHIEYIYIEHIGHGNAIKKAVGIYPHQYVLYMDISLPMPLVRLNDFFVPLEEGLADMMIARRIGKYLFMHRIFSWCMRVMNIFFLDMKYADTQSGIKAFNTASSALISQCHENGSFFNTEVVALAHHQKLRVQEIPVKWNERRFFEYKNNVHFIRDLLHKCAALMRITNRIYPQFFRSFFFFSMLGITLLGLWVTQWLISPAALFTPNPFMNRYAFFTSVYFPLAFGLATMLYGYTLRSFSHLPWRFFLIVSILFSGCMFFIAIITHPLHSEDVYWNLFYGKAFAIHHINPYITTPATVLSADPWISSFSAWKEVLMVYGPLWTLTISLIVLMGKTLAGSLLVLKVFETFLLVCAGYILWLVMAMHKFSLEKKAKIMIFFVWNPFIMYAAVVDGHNDILILMAMLLSYYFFLKTQYHYSIISLVLGGFVKYVSLLAILIPLFFLAISRMPIREKIFKFGGIAALSILLLFSLYAPFGGLKQENFYGAGYMVTTPGSLQRAHQIIFSAIISAILNFDVFKVRILGLIMGVILTAYFIWKKNIIGAYVYPYIFIFLFATPWFWPWYALWIFPLLAIIMPFSLLILTSTFLIIALGSFATVEVSLIFLLGAFFMQSYIIKK